MMNDERVRCDKKIGKAIKSGINFDFVSLSDVLTQWYVHHS